MSEVGTQKDKQSTPLVERVQAVRLICRQIRISKGWAVTGREKKYRKEQWRDKKRECRNE